MLRAKVHGLGSSLADGPQWLDTDERRLRCSLWHRGLAFLLPLCGCGQLSHRRSDLPVWRGSPHTAQVQRVLNGLRAVSLPLFGLNVDHAV